MPTIVFYTFYIVYTSEKNFLILSTPDTNNSSPADLPDKCCHQCLIYADVCVYTYIYIYMYRLYTIAYTYQQISWYALNMYIRETPLVPSRSIYFSTPCRSSRSTLVHFFHQSLSCASSSCAKTAHQNSAPTKHLGCCHGLFSTTAYSLFSQVNTRGGCSPLLTLSSTG